jgi:hypothetical protein
MRKTILAISLVTLALAVGVSAAMPEEQCENLAMTKDKAVQKNVVYEIEYNNYSYWDPCTQTQYICPNGITCEGPLLYSYDGVYPSHYQKWVLPSGTIRGKIIQNGWYGGQSVEYYICADGRAEVTHRSSGYYHSDSNTICSTIN